MEDKRKQTLLTLLNALTELKIDLDRRGAFQQPATGSSKDSELDEPPDEVHRGLRDMQVAGADIFSKFRRRVKGLDRELRKFANAARLLGFAVDALSSVDHLRERLTKILFLFQLNAADLFPGSVKSPKSSEPLEPALGAASSQTERQGEHITFQLRQPTAGLDVLDPEDFPNEMEMFASDIHSLRKSLIDFPEFGDEDINESFSSFETDLRYWASCLRTYEGQFRYPAIQRYLHDLTAEMGENLDNATTSLSIFLEIGIPNIRSAQKSFTSNILNLTTIATFVSAVTASTLQLSASHVGSPLADAVNGIWFLSLVFSIASVVNSLLGLTWKQAAFRSPGGRVPSWVLIWIKRTPLIFLVVSVAAFSVGFCLFAYSSGQHHITSVLTTTFTVCCSFGVLAVLTWLAFERWTFNRHGGKKRLMAVLSDRLPVCSTYTMWWLKDNVLLCIENTSNWILRYFAFTTECFSCIGARKLENHTVHPTSSSGIDEEEEYVLPLYEADSGRQSPLTGPALSENPATAPVLSPNLASRQSTAPPSDTPNVLESTLVTSSPARKPHLATIVRLLISKHTFTSSAEPKRRRSLPSLDKTQNSHRDPWPSGILRPSPLVVLKEELKSLEPMQNLTTHQTVVRHLEFSPNGKYLATCSWDHTCAVYSVKPQFAIHRVLATPRDSINQMAWSPDGTQVLTRASVAIKIWSADSGVCRKTINRHRAVAKVIWFPSGDAFLSAEEGCVNKFDLRGSLLDTYTLANLEMHDIVITPDSQRLFCVTSLLKSPDGLQPSKSKAGKQIIVYHLKKRDIESQIPVLNDVRHITLDQKGLAVLVSYANKAPPQLFKIEEVKDRDFEINISSRLSLSHTYIPKLPVDFVDPGCFGGDNDQLVLCAGKGGDIYIWNRQSGVLLHSLPPMNMGAELTCITCNSTTAPFMIAAGCDDGSVRIWATSSATNFNSKEAAVSMSHRRFSSEFQPNDLATGNSAMPETLPPWPPSFVNFSDGVEQTSFSPPEESNSTSVGSVTPRVSRSDSSEISNAEGPSNSRLTTVDNPLTLPDTI